MKAATALTAREAWALRNPVRCRGYRVEVYAEKSYYVECRDHPGWRNPPERIVLRNAYWGDRGNRIPERLMAPEAAERFGFLLVAAHGHEGYAGPCAHIRIRSVIDGNECWWPVRLWREIGAHEGCRCGWCFGPVGPDGLFDGHNAFPQVIMDRWEAAMILPSQSSSERLRRRLLREVRRDLRNRTRAAG